jgi:hypothetical protein
MATEAGKAQVDLAARKRLLRLVLRVVVAGGAEQELAHLFLPGLSADLRSLIYTGFRTPPAFPSAPDASWALALNCSSLRWFETSPALVAHSGLAYRLP